MFIKFDEKVFYTRFKKQYVLSPRSTVTLKTSGQDVALTDYRTTQSLYHPNSFMLFTTQLKLTLYHLTSTSNFFTFVRGL